jgi:hypothetical protein
LLHEIESERFSWTLTHTHAHPYHRSTATHKNNDINFKMMINANEKSFFSYHIRMDVAKWKLFFFLSKYEERKKHNHSPNNEIQNGWNDETKNYSHKSNLSSVFIIIIIIIIIVSTRNMKWDEFAMNENWFSLCSAAVSEKRGRI